MITMVRLFEVTAILRCCHVSPSCDRVKVIIYQAYTQSRDREVGAQQCQEKRQKGKNKGERRVKITWIWAEGKTSHPNFGKGCNNRGRKTEWKTGERTKERNRERVPNPATLGKSNNHFNWAFFR